MCNAILKTLYGFEQIPVIKYSFLIDPKNKKQVLENIGTDAYRTGIKQAINSEVEKRCKEFCQRT